MAGGRQAERYDALVIGAGQGGMPLAQALARSGRRTALVEREHVAGTCINEGCTPTKTMVASGRVAYLARRGAEYGVRTGQVSVDLARVRQRKRDIVESWRMSSERRMVGTAGLDLLMGEARFVGPRVVEVRLNDSAGAPHLEAEWVFLNTGARPSVPHLPGIEDVPVLTSTSVMELDQVPEHLLVLGGGYIGLEFGQLFRRFGSRVTLIQRGKRLLAREDGDVADAVAGILRQDGVEVLLETTTERVERDGRGVALTLRTAGGEPARVVGSHLLAAVGRAPNTERLDPAAGGVEVDAQGFVRVNERLETTAPGVYALGDVKGGPAFTHISYDDFRILRTNLLEGGSATTRERLVPYTVFIDPQLGRVGLTEDDARAQGRSVRVAKIPMGTIARALEVDEARGFLKAVVDAESGLILGFAALGLEGGELMAMVEIAMLGQLPYTVLREAVFAHPTLAEGLNNLFYNFVE